MRKRISFPKAVLAVLLAIQNIPPSKAQDNSTSTSMEDMTYSGPLPGEGKIHIVSMPTEVRDFSNEFLQYADILTREALAAAKTLACPTRSQLHHIPDIALGLKLEASRQPDFSITDYPVNIDLEGHTWERFARRAARLTKMRRPWAQPAHRLEIILVQTAGNYWSWKPNDAPDLPSVPDRLKSAYRVFVTLLPLNPDDVSPIATCLYSPGSQNGIVAEIVNVALHPGAKGDSILFEKTDTRGELTDFNSGAVAEKTSKRRAAIVHGETVYAEIGYDLAARSPQVKSVTFNVKTSKFHGTHFVPALKRVLSTGENLLADSYLIGGSPLYRQSVFTIWKKPAPPEIKASSMDAPLARNLPVSTPR